MANFPMRQHVLISICAVAVLTGLGTMASAGPADAAVAAKSIPPFSEVQAAVSRHFKKQRDFQPGDLMTRDQIEPLLKRFQKSWLPSADARAILTKTPAKGEFFVDQLHTPKGRKFMRRIAAYPEGYDRLDRLSRLPQGKQTVRMLVQDPRGDRMIEYMTTTQGGRELGRMLSAAPRGARFNAPTGRIYTVTMLLARLQQSHTAAVKAAGKRKSP